MATAKQNDSGIIDDIDKQCDDDSSTSTKDQLPVSEQESVSTSIAVSKDGPVHEIENDRCQIGSKIVTMTTQSFITEENGGHTCVPPVCIMQQPAHKEQQQDLQRDPTLEQQWRSVQEMKIKVELREQQMKLQELECEEQMKWIEFENKKRELERQRQSEEVEHEIMMCRKRNKLEYIQQQNQDTFRQGDNDIDPGPLPNLNCDSTFSANVEDREIERQIHAQEHNEFKCEQKCFPVEEVTTYDSVKDSIVTGMDKLQVGQPTDADVSKDPEQDDHFPPDFDGKGVLIAMPEVPHVTNAWQQSSNTGYENHIDEAVLLEETRTIARGAGFTFYSHFDAAHIAKGIGVLTDKWLQNTYYHTFIICVPSAWNYNRELEAAICRAQSEDIVFVFAAVECRGGGRVYPAAFGSCFAIGEQSPDSSTMYGGALDHVEPGELVHHKNGRIHGASISAARFTGRLALFSESLYAAVDGVFIHKTAVLKEHLLLGVKCDYTSHAGYGRVDFKSLIQRPAQQKKVDHAHITTQRDRKEYQSIPFPDDAKDNTKLWRTLNPAMSLSGEGIALAMIDDISNDYLNHIAQKPHITIYYKNNIKYFYIRSKELMQECCLPYHRGNHILQCGAIVANTSPDCMLLLIKCHKHDDQESALTVVKKEQPHILLVSAVTTDTFTKFCDSLAPILSSCVVLCAAGNEGKSDRNTICYPARAGNLIVVGACDRLGNRCAYSSIGRELSLLSPGQFDVADSAGRGATCYATAAAGAFIAQFLQHINTQCKGASICTMPGSKKEAISNLVRNTHLMKKLLCNPRMGLCCKAEHSATEGYGMLQIEKISTVTRELIVYETKILFT